MKEEEEEEDKKTKRTDPVTVRVRLPDGTQLLGMFGPREPIGAVRAFVHESLREPFRRFDLAFLGAPLRGDENDVISDANGAKAKPRDSLTGLRTHNVRGFVRTRTAFLTGSYLRKRARRAQGGRVRRRRHGRRRGLSALRADHVLVGGAGAAGREHRRRPAGAERRAEQGRAAAGVGLFFSSGARARVMTRGFRFAFMNEIVVIHTHECSFTRLRSPLRHSREELSGAPSPFSTRARAPRRLSSLIGPPPPLRRPRLVPARPGSPPPRRAQRISALRSSPSGAANPRTHPGPRRCPRARRTSRSRLR